MTLDKFTIKAQEAVQQAVNSAQLNGQQVIEPVHILKGVLEKAKDVANFIFQKLSVNAQQVEMLVDQEIKHLPKVQGGQPYLSNDGDPDPLPQVGYRQDRRQARQDHHGDSFAGERRRRSAGAPGFGRSSRLSAALLSGKIFKLRIGLFFKYRGRAPCGSMC